MIRFNVTRQAVVLAAMLTLLSACGDQPAPAASTTAAPAAQGTAAKPADAKAAEAAKTAKKEEEGHNPLEHEGIPGMADLFSKKKE